MKYTRLGRTGLQVSRLCLGTMTFGYQCDEKTSVAIMDKAFDAGVTFFDTADVYPLGAPAGSTGRTEEFVGRWLNGRRDRIILATKCFGRSGPARWDQGNSRKHILDAVDASLKRLGTDYIDLYQLHGPDPETPIDETMRALEDVVRSGKVRYVGCSNFMAYQVARAVGRSEALNIVRFDSVQPRYNMLFREIERELLPLCGEEGIGVIPYNPIAGGLLSGKHNPSAGPEEGSRFTLGTAAERYQDRYWHEGMFETVEQLRPIAQEAGMSLPQMAVAWVMANPVITAPIIGASRPEQLDDTVKAIDTPLTPELKQRLDDLTAQYRKGDAAR
ncbi:MAG: aldo/keto reductase [bacterium]